MYERPERYRYDEYVARAPLGYRDGFNQYGSLHFGETDPYRCYQTFYETPVMSFPQPPPPRQIHPFYTPETVCSIMWLVSYVLLFAPGFFLEQLQCITPFLGCGYVFLACWDLVFVTQLLLHLVCSSCFNERWSYGQFIFFVNVIFFPLYYLYEGTFDGIWQWAMQKMLSQ